MKRFSGAPLIVLVSILCAASIVATYVYLRPKTVLSYTASTKPPVTLVGKDLSDPTITSSQFANWQNLLVQVADASDTGTTTVTDNFAQGLFEKFMILKGQEGMINPDDEEALVSDLIQETDSIQQNAKVYTQKDLSVVATNPETIATYANDFNAAIAAHPTSGDNNEIVLLAGIVGDDNTNDIPKIDNAVDNYNSLIKSLLEMPVPDAAASMHLAVINDLSVISKNIETFKLAYDDPLVMTEGVQAYLSASQSFAGDYATLQKYMSDNGQSI